MTDATQEAAATAQTATQTPPPAGAPPPAVPETAKPAANGVPAQDERVSRALNQVARAEAEVVKRTKALAEERRALDAERAEAKREVEEARSLKAHIDQIKKGGKPVHALRELGVDFDDFVKRVSGEGTPENMLAETRAWVESIVGERDKKIAALEEKLTRSEAKEQEREAERAGAEAEAWATQFIDQNHGRFPELDAKTPKKQAALLNTKANAYHAEHGVYPTLDICADLVEADLADEVKEETARKGRRTPAPAVNGTTAAAKPAPKGAASTTEAASTPAQEAEDEEESMADVIARRRNGRFSATPATTAFQGLSNRAASERAGQAPPMSREEHRRAVAAKHLRK